MGYLLLVILIIALFFTIAYWFQEKLIFFPEKLSPDFQFSFREPFVERNFIINSQVTINTLHFNAQNPKGIILYFHGNAGNLQGWGGVADDFIIHHYDVLIIDYRGYGKSTGKISEKSLFSDAQSIYNELKIEYTENNILIYGRSIGAGIAAWLASQNNPGMLILESPLYSLPDLAHQYYPWFPGKLIRFKFRNDLYIERVKCRVFIIHGADDEIIPVHASYKLAEKLTPGDELTIVPGGHHNDLALFPEYHAFLAGILR
jgi:hypothetical protein